MLSLWSVVAIEILFIFTFYCIRVFWLNLIMSSGKGYDPGWNDPPLFSFEKSQEIQSSAEKKRISLNKRVAFPMGSRPGSGGMDPTAPPTSSDRTLPPPGAAVRPIPLNPTGLPETPSSTSDPDLNCSEESLKVVANNLRKVNNSDSSDEIVKRIEILEKMWTDGCFDIDVKRRLMELSEALIANDITTADRVQKGLMVDHVTVCSSWMSGIRQLINKLRDDHTAEQ